MDDDKEPWRVWLQAFSKLLENLNGLTPASRQREQTEESLKTAREEYVIGLTVVATFISTFDKKHGEWFFDLASKFGDLNKGHQIPLFRPAKVIDRPEDTTGKWIARARAVLAIEALVRTGIELKQAAEQIATEHPGLREFAGAKAAETPLNKVLLNWRKEFQRKEWRAGRPKNPGVNEGQIVYEEGIKKIGDLLASGNRDRVRAIADSVSDSVFSPPRPTNISG